MLRALLALVVFASPLLADELELQGNIEVVKVDKVIVVKEDRTVVKSLPFKVAAPAGAADYRWTVPAGIAFTDLGNKIEITSAPKGELSVTARRLIVDFEAKATSFKIDTITFNVGDVTVPVPPKPIDPIPKPPVVKPPVPVAGLRVMVIAESTNGALLLSQKQINELYGEKMADYARTKLAKGPDGTPEKRCVDKDSDPSKMNPVWQQFFAVWQKEANGVVPWIVVSNGDTGFSGPLPDGDGSIIAIIRRFEP